MGGGQQETGGPDLGQGIALEELADGGIVQGHVGEAGVVMARVDGEVYAIDAGCTHYGVPLGGGIVVGHTIRCPAHHSRFEGRPLAVATIARDRPSLGVEAAIEAGDLARVEAAIRGAPSTAPARDDAGVPLVSA